MIELRTIEELAVRHGQKFARVAVPGDSRYTASHHAADVRHGWTRHEATAGEAVKLTDSDYLAALDAVMAGKIHIPASKRGK